MKSYRAEVIVRGASYRSVAYATRELAASALPRVLMNHFWQERLTREPPASWSVGIVEEEGPACERDLGGLDLECFSEALRRRLYDQVVADYFSPRSGSRRKPEDHWPPYSPEEAHLEVVYWEGRWFATWKRLELEEGNDADRSELLRIHSTERGITYHEV